jgi:hypothetical protein
MDTACASERKSKQRCERIILFVPFYLFFVSMSERECERWSKEQMTEKMLALCVLRTVKDSERVWGVSEVSWVSATEREREREWWWWWWWGGGVKWNGDLLSEASKRGQNRVGM